MRTKAYYLSLLKSTMELLCTQVPTPFMLLGSSRWGSCRCQHCVLLASWLPRSFERELTYVLPHNERYGGTQSRTFPGTPEINETKAETKYEHGVLELTLPQKSGAI